MDKIYRLIILSFVLFTFFSCDKEEDLLDESVVITEQAYQNELDEWIYENLTLPYNVEVKYKWNDGEVDNQFSVVPPKIEKAKEFLEAYLNIWIKSYEAEAKAGGDPAYLHKYMPKLLVLVGSPAYMNNSLVLGMAEGGRKVSIFDVNSFGNFQIWGWESEERLLELKKDAIVKSFHTLHHEFAHIMHQTKFYTNDFKEICKGDYTANWQGVTDEVANIKGFVTPYSMLNENEDFVEIVAAMLTKVLNSNEAKLWKSTQLNGEDGYVTDEVGDIYLSEWEGLLYTWNWVINEDTWTWLTTPESYESKKKFEQKVDIVTTYYQEKWGVDLYSLQKRIEAATELLINEQNN